MELQDRKWKIWQTILNKLFMATWMRLLRVPFVEIEGRRKVLTVYWTSKIERYWKGEKENEDKI